jgi:hypothetical protein
MIQNAIIFKINFSSELWYTSLINYGTKSLKMLTSIKLQLHNITFCFLLTQGLARAMCRKYSCQASTLIIYKRQSQTSLPISMSDRSFIKMEITLYLQHRFSNNLLPLTYHNLPQSSFFPITIHFFPERKTNYISSLMLQHINKSSCKAISNTQSNLYGCYTIVLVKDSR